MATQHASGHTYTRLAIAAGVLAAVVILGCGGAANANNGTTTSGSSSNSSSSAAKHFKVGDQVNVGNTWVVTVNSVKTSQGDEFTQPKAGNTYVVVDVTLKNTSSQEQNVSSLLSFSLKDSTGQKYDETIITGATPPDGKVAAGDVLRGQIPYEVPSSMH